MSLYRAYSSKKLGAESLALVHQANDIIEEYEKQGFGLTLRQLYYQFVARALLPNTQASYNRLGSIVSDGRMVGLISWDSIEDRTRNLMGSTTYKSPSAAMRSIASGYRRDLWAGQPWRPEVWVEKEALVGVISGICSRLRVDFFAQRGYNSQSEQWRAGRRFASYIQRGQRPIVFHLGDHDPSGVDMTRDNADRLSLFAGYPIQVQRLALNMSQIEELRPPPNPAKVTDARFADYQAKYHTDESWELDALDPRTISNLIENAVQALVDPHLWNQALSQEVDDLREIEEAANAMD